MSRALRLAAGGVAVFLATTPLLFRGGSDGDVREYRTYGDLILHGHVPYRDFFLEYPPGALPIFALPSVATEHAYVDVFRVLTSIAFAIGIVLVALLVTRLRLEPPLAWASVLFAALTPLALGAFALRRFDVWPTDCALGVLLLVLARRPRLAFALLAVGTLVKTWPVVLLPLVWLAVDRRARLPGLAVFCAIGIVVLGPFAVIAHGGLYNSYAVQAQRDLHVDSLGSSILLALHRPVHFYFDRGGWNVGGSGAGVIAKLQTLLEAAVVAVAAVAYARSRRAPRELVAAAAVAVTAAACLGKVLSPQYLVWAAPFLLAARARVAAVAFAAAMLATNLLFPDRYLGLLARHDGEIWLLLVRNLLLVGAVGALLVRLARVSARARAD